MYKRHILAAAVLSIGGIGLASSPAWAQAQADPQAQQQPAAPSAQPSAQQLNLLTILRISQWRCAPRLQYILVSLPDSFN